MEQAFSAAAQNAQPQEEIDRVKHELVRMEAALYESYCDAGKALLEAAETENRKINALVDEIVEIRRLLAALCKESGCPACGSMNAHDSLFCSRCGERLDDLREESHL